MIANTFTAKFVQLKTSGLTTQNVVKLYKHLQDTQSQIVADKSKNPTELSPALSLPTSK